MNDNVARVIAENGYYGSMDKKPATEQELFNLQEEYLNKRDIYDQEINEWIKDTSKPKPVDTSIEVWSKMLSIIYNYAASLIKKRNTGKKYTEPDEISDKAFDAAFKFMSSYNRRPNFAIGASFAGNLTWKVLEATSEDKKISLNQPTSYDDQLELLDTLQEDSFTHIGGLRSTLQNPEDAFIAKSENIIQGILDELDAEVGKNSRIAFITRLYLLINLRVPRTRHIKRLFLENWAQDYKVEQVIESTVLEVFNRYGGKVMRNQPNDNLNE